MENKPKRPYFRLTKEEYKELSSDPNIKSLNIVNDDFSKIPNEHTSPTYNFGNAGMKYSKWFDKAQREFNRITSLEHIQEQVRLYGKPESYGIL